MKTRGLIFYFVCWVFGQICSAQTEVSIVPDNGTALYRCGEAATWNIYLEKDGEPLNDPVEYTVKRGGLEVVDSGTLELKDGQASVSASRSDPGALLMQLKLDAGSWKLNGKQMQKAAGGAIFDREKIHPSGEEAPEFDAFWERKLAELAAVPVNVKLEKVDNDEVDLWEISMDNIRGTKICGHLARPRNSDGPFPACANFEGAGVRRANPYSVIQQAKNGWLSLNIIAHSIDAYREPAYYEKLSRNELKGYPEMGRDNPETCYFLRMMLATFRCVDYLSQRDDWNGTVLRANGGSQGGWQAIAAAALNPKVTVLTANVSAGCDQTGPLIGRQAGWPKAFWQKEDSIRTSKYFDAVFFARRVKCPALIGVGAIDPVCPPEGVCAMYNQLAGPKQLIVMPAGAHNGVGHQSWQAALRRLENNFKTGNIQLEDRP
ncbi:acetylxylan esterase [Tichowtungia aerotolerans]|uniref:Acetyl xylan esterase domain-containing protein n=1 Tax=Tichowtungia aerotolerans TaxID=2697043 RepID=A0A6P1ME28_9BACT|nr:acetylxylan esterase [Tichowtungia aerotolerans]QHI70318.1 hypothetical protein GT409_12995 [Tichowtungia aerotolerans]